MSTKKTALVATTLAMALTASVFASTPANAAPAPTIPNQVALKMKDVKRYGADTVFDLGVTTTGTVTFAGQFCDTFDNGATGLEPLPSLSRWWSWYDADNDLDVSIEQVVTVWDDPAGALVDVQNDTGYCRVFPGDTYTVVESDDDSWAAQFGAYAVAVERVNGSLVAITVHDWNNRIDEMTEAQRLLDIAVPKAARSPKLP